jgi:hypothetical protein
MKTLFASALIAATAAVSLPAAADQVAPGAAAAIAHFNQSADSQDDRVSIPAAEFDGVRVSTRSGTDLGAVFAHFNADAESQDDVSGQQGATVVSGKPVAAQGILAQIRVEGLENE